MATKAMLMKLLQESRGHELITNRRPTPRPIVLYLMQLRAQTSAPQIPKQRLAIKTEWEEGMSEPQPIEIKHILADQGELPIVIG